MCGIAGIYAYGAPAPRVNMGELLAVRDAMVSRGPDGEGMWMHQDGIIGLAHRRLSIIDLSERAGQPMVSVGGAQVVTFNGEIYNFRELRRELQQRGRVFSTQSDTEVLLHLYDERGADMVHALRGMFSFVIWDEDKRRLFLARDPYGIKPLYYADDGATFRFASQVKALMAGGAISNEPDPAGWTGFFMFGSVPEPFTTFKCVHTLPAGSHLFVTADGVGSIQRYHSIGAVCNEADSRRDVGDGSPQACMTEAREALVDSVRHHLVSDVPVGAFLSGGIDSGALVGLMRDAGQSDIQTVTLAFSEYRGQSDDETPLAAEVAKKYGTRHKVRFVPEDEFRTELPSLLAAMDQPTIDGINTWFVSKAAQELGLKVAVSGVGGDELFGGYPSFCDIPRSVAVFKAFKHLPRVSRGLRKLFNAFELGRLGVPPKAAGLLEFGGTFAGAYLLRRGLFMPWELDKVLDPDMVREGLEILSPIDRIEQAMAAAPDSAFAKVSTLESSLYMRNQLLKDTDWTSMAHSLEVRVPLVDSVLLSRLAGLTSDASWQHGKRMLGASPVTPLPQSVLSKSKTGFTTPIGEWMKSLPVGPSKSEADLKAPAQHWSRDWARFVHSEMTRPSEVASEL